MFTWRITKYDPCNRDESGAYTALTWTSYSDIGKIFDGEELTYEKYKIVEDAYINAIKLFMKCMAIDSLKITMLEKGTTSLHDQHSLLIFNTLKDVKKGRILHTEEIETISRLTLREYMWCKLETSNMYVHFGYDFYMYIGTKNSCEKSIIDIKESGLFVESYQSPHA